MSRDNLLSRGLARLFFGRGGGYDAIKQPNRRKNHASRTRSADAEATQHERGALAATSRDARRNFEVLAWAIRKHLDYVTRFSFQARTDNEELNDTLETWMSGPTGRRDLGRASASRFDAARRHPLRRALRIIEASRTVDGDVFPMKIAATPDSPYRGRLSLIEGDRIRDPETKGNNETWTRGVHVGPYGQALKYAVYNRGAGGAGWNFWRNVGADSMMPVGYFDRFDQVRGVSPLVAALNRFRDVYDGFDLTMAKVKLSQIFGVITTREGDDELSPGIGGETDEDGEFTEAPKIPFEGGPFHFDFEPGEAATVIESKTPATETVAFFRLMIHAALKSLDIPFSFFDESFTNYYGQRAAEIGYRESCVEKIADLVVFLDDWTRWAMAIDIADGRLKLPPGTDLDAVAWEWVPAGKPWWDPSKEIRGRSDAIAKGLDTPQRACRETGSDYFDNIDQIAAAQEYAQRKGVTIDFTGAAKLAAPSPNATEGDGNA